MKSSFIVGIALGALAGMAVIQNSSQAKRMFQKGQQMVESKMNDMSSQNTSNMLASD